MTKNRATKNRSLRKNDLEIAQEQEPIKQGMRKRSDSQSIGTHRQERGYKGQSTTKEKVKVKTHSTKAILITLING